MPGNSGIPKVTATNVVASGCSLGCPKAHQAPCRHSSRKRPPANLSPPNQNPLHQDSHYRPSTTCSLHPTTHLQTPLLAAHCTTRAAGNPFYTSSPDRMLQPRWVTLRARTRSLHTTGMLSPFWCALLRIMSSDEQVLLDTRSSSMAKQT